MRTALGELSTEANMTASHAVGGNEWRVAGDESTDVSESEP